MATVTQTFRNIESNRALPRGLWIAQGFLAFVFALAGALKLFAPLAALSQKMAWVHDVPPPLVRFIGLCELVAAVALIVPSLDRFRRFEVTGIAAAGLVVLMIVASGFHLQRREPQMLLITGFLALIAGLVSWERIRQATLLPPRAQAP